MKGSEGVLYQSLRKSGAFIVAAIFVWSFSILVHPIAVQAQTSGGVSSVASLFAGMKPSLAIIARGTFVGSAFCITSNSDASYYLTNAHVVGSEKTVTVYRQFPTYKKMVGTVVALGLQEDPDLAVVRVSVGSIPSLPLQLASPHEGDPIAVAGYPSAQYNLADISGEIVPSIHQGTVSAVENRGGIVEYDALSEHGNSGGPLFDPRTGNVIGIVQFKLVGSTEANVGIGIARIVVPFLKTNSIAYRAAQDPSSSVASGTTQTAESPVSSTVLKTLPGANVVAVVYDTSRSTGDGASLVLNAANDFAQKFSQRFNVRTITLLASFPIDKQKAAEIAEANGALTIAIYGPSFRSMGYDQFMGTTKWDLGVGVSLMDMYGQSWYSRQASKSVASARNADAAVVSSLADLDDQVVSALYSAMSAGGDGTQIVNFFRYALPMANGEHRVFVNYKATDKGAQVTFLPAFSPAAEAGLQIGDIILTINGESVVGKTQEELNRISISNRANINQDYLIVAADGSQQHIKLESKDLRWFVERRSSQHQ